MVGGHGSGKHAGKTLRPDPRVWVSKDVMATLGVDLGVDKSTREW